MFSRARSGKKLRRRQTWHLQGNHKGGRCYGEGQGDHCHRTSKGNNGQGGTFIVKGVKSVVDCSENCTSTTLKNHQ
jgi:hypothetical protein